MSSPSGGRISLPFGPAWFKAVRKEELLGSISTLARRRPAYINLRLSKRISIYVFCVAFGLVFWWLAENSSSPRAPYSASRLQPVSAQPADQSQFGQLYSERLSDQILKGETLSQALQRNGFAQAESLIIIDKLQKEMNLRNIRPGDVLVRESDSDNRLLAFELIRDEAPSVPVRYRIQRDAGSDSFALTKMTSEVFTRQEKLIGSIETNLYDAILFSGGDAALVNRFSDFFGWQIDFYRETQRGDAFKMLVETKYVDGRFVGYGKVVAAEYAPKSRTTPFRGFAFQSKDGQIAGIYDEKGVSLAKTFLKSPLELARITSRYGQRFHPILRKQKKHNGVDYGASTGTPFWAVADGLVLEARYSPSAGNMIRIKHRNGYVTEYFHASKIAPGVRAGAHVRQRQVIGYVGTTGRSTGPHLHFGMMLEKNYVDPARQNFPTGEPLPRKELEIFKNSIQPMIAELSLTPQQDATAHR